ncbi:MAG: Maf family protein [Elusimicrobium sp.]|jgi:septum formation protein|nr:Maf family protein [Elusimicrobium sp.]
MIILASRSPRRIELLTKAGYKFKIVPALGEEKTRFKKPAAMVRDLALKKAFEVAVQYPAETVAGADTLVFCKGRVIGKPKNAAHALEILKLLNNSWQTVYTGVAIINLDKKKLFTGVAKTRCKARRLTDAQLKKLAGKHLDKAGGYAVQDEDDMLIEKIAGSRTNVVGMPMELFKKMTGEFK